MLHMTSGEIKAKIRKLRTAIDKQDNYIATWSPVTSKLRGAETNDLAAAVADTIAFIEERIALVKEHKSENVERLAMFEEELRKMQTA